jgi:hypothetical protein
MMMPFMLIILLKTVENMGMTLAYIAGFGIVDRVITNHVTDVMRISDTKSYAWSRSLRNRIVKL